jgi:hydroxyacid-oxoacid transhydrogenase
VLIVTDEGVAATGIPGRAAESLQNAGLKPTVFSGARVEPTDVSFRAAAEFAAGTDWDGWWLWAAARPSTPPRRSTC